MDHNGIKMLFIMLILIFACLIILSQCNCFHCNFRCNCKKNNRVNIHPPIMVHATPVETLNNGVIIVGEPVIGFDINRENTVPVDSFVINVVE